MLPDDPYNNSSSEITSFLSEVGYTPLQGYHEADVVQHIINESYNNQLFYPDRPWADRARHPVGSTYWFEHSLFMFLP